MRKQAVDTDPNPGCSRAGIDRVQVPGETSRSSGRLLIQDQFQVTASFNVR